MATIVIVPGSFCPSHCYETLVDSLSGRGISSIVVSTPSVGPRPGGLPPATMSDDAAEIVRTVEPLLAEGKKVILFTHSYGGIPGTQSLDRLSLKARAAQGKTGGIETLVYLTSAVLPVGMSNWDASGGELPDFVTIQVPVLRSRMTAVETDRNFEG